MITASLWTPPRAPHFKVNFDASVSTIHRLVGIGVVIRDCEGQFIAGLSRRIPIQTSADLAEALAAREAVSLARTLMIPSFILEGDASSVVKQICSSDEILSDLGTVIEDIRLSLLNLPMLNVVWTPREANRVAHSLAQFARSSSLSESLWNFPRLLPNSSK
nr:uncharacterized protein LOC113687569 [Coffea arabica]